MNEKAIQKALKNASPGGTISCSEAFVLSKTQGIPIGMIGKTANELGIKITDCQLGCFGSGKNK